MNNALAQSEELLALKSIYEDKDLIWDDDEPPCGRFIVNVQLNNPFYIYCAEEETNSKEFNESTKCKVQEKIKVEYLPPLNLVFKFPETYPSTTCPAFLLSCNWLTIYQLSKLCKHLEVLWEEGHGEVVLFRWTQFLQEETLEFLEIYNCLDITELSKCSFKTNFINSIDSDNQATSKLSSLSLHTKVDCDENFKTEEVQPPSSNSESTDFALKLKSHSNKNTHIKHLDIVMNCITPSVSGGCGIKDKRAFLDLPDGRNLLKLILDFEKFKNQENFEMTWHNCKICFLDKKGFDFVKFRDCGHTYCKECLQLYFEVQIKEGNVHLLNCPEEKCSSQADDTLVKQLVRTDLYNKYDNLLLSRTLEGMSDIAYCPRQICQCPLLIDSAGRIGICPACSFVFCPYCKMAYHGIAPCNFKSEEKQNICSTYMNGDVQQKEDLEKRYGKRAMQALVNDTLSENWMKSFSKNCPRCNASIEKTDGCNKMTCFRCGTYFCWLCMSPLQLINPYMHFNNVKSQCYGLLFPDDYLDAAFEVEPGEFLNMD